MDNPTSRRNVIKKIATGSIAAAALSPFDVFANNEMESTKKLKGNINHSVCQWTYGFLSLDQLCIEAKKMGLGAIDLIGPKEWPVLQSHGLHCSMCYTGGKISLTEGWNRQKFHAPLIKEFTETIPLMAQAGYKNLICFSGNRDGLDDEAGLTNCVTGLKHIMALAEKHDVIIQMELFNSKVDHKDYMCDKSAWGIELCKRLDSPNFKLLYDIYHMQINEGDVIRTIKDNHQYF